MVLAVVALTAFAAWRLGRAVLGATGLWLDAGPLWAVLAVVALALFRFSLPLRIGVVLGSITLLGWPWYLGVLLAAPRLLLMLPGYVSALLARIRHPRPNWPGVQTHG
jgi:hypothetical protein